MFSKELLSKYAKTQEKLEQLKRHQRLMKLESISFSTAKNRDKTPPQKQKQQQHETNPFSPDKVKILMLKFTGDQLIILKKKRILLTRSLES